MNRGRHLWAIGYDNMGRAEQVRGEISRLDAEANATCRPAADVTRRGSRSRILVIATREDVTMLQEVPQLLGGNQAEAS